MKAPSNTYLQSAWNEDPIPGVNLEHVREAMRELQLRPHQHDAFWVGILSKEETVLELSKDLSMVVVVEGDEMNSLEKRARSQEEAESIYALFLSGDMEAVLHWFEQVR